MDFPKMHTCYGGTRVHGSSLTCETCAARFKRVASAVGRRRPIPSN